MNRRCANCGNPFELKDKRAWNKKYCSHKCTPHHRLQVSGYKSKGIPTATVGTIAEIVVCLDLLKKGYSVFRSISPSSNFDLVAFKNEKMISVEVRSGYLSNNKPVFPKKEKDKAEYYAVVIHEVIGTLEQIRYIPNLPQ